MAFTEIEKGIFQNGTRKSISPVRMVSSGITATFVISAELMKQIGDKPFAKLLLGSGEHDGLFAVIPQQDKTKNAYRFGRYGKMRGSRLAVGLGTLRLPAVKIKPVNLPFEITEDGLVIDIRKLRKPSLVAA